MDFSLWKKLYVDSDNPSGLLILFFFINIIIRLIIKHPFPIRMDSYYYFRIAMFQTLPSLNLFEIVMCLFGRLWGVINLIMILFCILIFYTICIVLTNKRNPSLLATLFFSFSPFFWFNSNIMLYDKNLTILLLFLLVINGLVEKDFILTLVPYFILIFFWPLHWLVLLFMCIYNYKFIIKYKIFIPIVIMICVVISLLYGPLYFKDSMLISETWSMLLLISPMYVFWGFVSGLKNSNWKIKLMLFFAWGLSLLAFRFTIFLFPLIYIGMAISLTEMKAKKDLIRIIVIVFVVLAVLSYPMYNSDPTRGYGDDLRNNKSYICSNVNNTHIYADWGKGHILQYYLDDCNNTLVMKGHPNQKIIKNMMNLSISGTYLLYKDDIKLYPSYCKIYNITNCSILNHIPDDGFNIITVE